MINITLLWKPISTQNAYWQRGKIRYMKKNAKDTKASYIIQARSQYRWDILEWDLSISIKLYFPDRRRRDRDNRHKISMDALEGIVYKDDCQIQNADVYKEFNKENPRIEIIIKKV